MRFFVLIIIILLAENTGYSQTWSGPIIISESGLNSNPDFKIDHDGVIHCSWVRYLDYSYSRIYYSKSINSGDTWTDPIPITTNTKLWLDDPNIVIDTFGNLYVSYDYDVGSWPKTKICYVKFNTVDSTWSQPIEIATGMANRLVIDQNNRVFFFWFAGTEFYRYLDNDILSDTLTPYPGTQIAYYFENFTVDKNNKIHCVGNRTAGSHAHGAYFTYFDEYWSPHADLSSESFFESGISLNSNGIPSFVWRQRMPDSSYYIRGTYYAESDGDTVTTPIFLGKETSYPVISIDCNDLPHIVESQAYDSTYHLIHRYFSENGWQSEVLEQNKNWYNQNVLISNNSHLYLIYNKVDTTHSSQIGFNGMIIFRKLEIVPGIFKKRLNPEIVLYPNPFSKEVTIEFSDNTSNKIDLSIFDLFGRNIFKKGLKGKSQSTGSFVWKGINNLGKQVEDGSYIMQLSIGSTIIGNKIVIRMHEL